LQRWRSERFQQVRGEREGHRQDPLEDGFYREGMSLQPLRHAASLTGMRPDATARGEVEGRSRPALVEAGGARAARGGERGQMWNRHSDSLPGYLHADLRELAS